MNQNNAAGSYYPSPIGVIFLSADKIGLTGLWFADQKAFLQSAQQEPPSILAAKRWLDVYFSGTEPDFTPPLHPVGSPFQREVWNILCTIPYGNITTYGEIAKQIAAQRGLPTMSAQAVGGAVGRNPISLIIPCHRVIGANGSLTGYAGGVERKRILLELEKAKISDRQSR